MAFIANMIGLSRMRGIGTPAAYHVELTPFFQKVYRDDLANVFFNSAQFAEKAVYTHSTLGIAVTYDVIYDDPTTSINLGVDAGFNSLRPQFQIPEYVLKHPVQKDDFVFVRGKKFFIDEFVSDGVGVTTCFLRFK